jgi:hypothetical protein
MCSLSFGFINKTRYEFLFLGAPVIMALSVLRLNMQETAAGYEG